jgi:hypothetical protein
VTSSISEFFVDSFGGALGPSATSYAVLSASPVGASEPSAA